MPYAFLLLIGTLLAGQPATRPAPTQATSGRPLSTLIDVELRADRTRLQVNTPVEVEFLVRNITAEPVELTVPLGPLTGKLAEGFPLTAMGLPLEHVFSGENFRALSVAIEGDPYMGDRVMSVPGRTIPPIVIAPFGEVGIRFDISRNYPMLRQEGRYELRWKPYGGAVQSRPLTIEIQTYKQVVMETDVGRLTFRLLYDKAPLTVENFVDLVDDQFYNELAFFLVNPSLAVQAGCPKGDGTSRRPDGRTIEPEFNDTPFDLGTVGMALTQTGPNEVDPNSASAQFFITLSRQSSLDGRYTAFAQVEGPDSMETLRRIAATPRGPNGYPLKPIAIRSTSLVDAPIPPTSVTRK